MADFRGYVTAAGQTFEALAKQMGYPVTIGFIEVGDGKLPDSESPIARTQLVHKLKQFPAIVEQDANNPGQWVATCYIPADDAINGAGYFIREIGCKLINQGAGVLYAYRRVSDDWKPVITSGEAKSFIYKLRFIPSNGELLTPTIDPSVVLVDKEELARAMKSHEDGSDHQLVKKLKTEDGASNIYSSSGKSIQDEINHLTGLFGVSVNIADYASLKDAIAALPVFGGTVYVPIGRYYAGDWNYNIDYMKKPNISLVGQKKPTWNDDASALVGGSVIYGRFNCFADNFSVVDVGFDMGKKVIDEFYAGASTLSANHPLGGTWDAFAFAQPNMSVPLRQRRGFSAKGVITLCKESNTVGHSFLAEGFNGGFVDDIIGIYSVHAVVIKAQNVRGGTVSGFMASVDNVIFKSDTYAPGGDIQLNAVFGARTLPNCTPHSAPVIANYGLYFHPATANFTGPIQVGSVTCKGSSHGVAGNTLTGVDIQLGQVIVDGNTGQMLYGVDFGSTGKFRRITIGSFICNNVVDALYVKHAADPTATDPQVHIGSMHVTNATGIAITAADSAVITVDSLELKKVAMAYNFASQQAKIRIGAARLSEVNHIFQNPITLNAGWSNYGAGNSSFEVFLHDYGVKVKGLLIAGAGATGTISPLLASIRPQENLRFPSYKRVAGAPAFCLVGVDAVIGLLIDDGAAPTQGSWYSVDGLGWNI